MAPRNTRVNPADTVRSPARSFQRALDSFYAPARDVRSEQALQSGLGAFGAILTDKSNELKAERREDEFNQGVADAMREQAGQELKGVRTGSIFRQHSKYYMAGLNETRGKAAASRFKEETALAYQEWEGRHTDDDGSAFREWMNGRVSGFLETLGDDPQRLAGAMPTINEVARNFATQHTGFTAQRLEQESYEAYDEIVSGIFSDMSSGNIDMDTAVDRLTDEAMDMYETDGAAAKDRVVNAAIRYANIHNDPDAILAMARMHDKGDLKLSQQQRERLADAMDAVEADIERETSRRSARDEAAAKAEREAALNGWAQQLAEDPYAELPTFAEVGDQTTYRQMVSLQDAFIQGSAVDNPAIVASERMALEADLHAATSPGEKIRILSEFTRSNPTALSGSDVSKYTKEIFATTNPGSLINDSTVAKYREGFGRTLAAFQHGDGFDANSLSYLQTQGERHFNDYMLANAGRVDMNDPAAIRQAVKEAEEYAMEQLAFDFPDVIREKNEQSPLGQSLGANEALETRDTAVAEEAKALYEGLAGQPTGDETQPIENPEPVAVEPQSAPDVPLEEQEVPFDDPETDEPYSPTREGFYGEVIQRFTDGRDDRPDGQTLIDIAGDVLQADPEFAVEVDALAAELNIPPGAILAVMDFETGGSFSTSVRNAAGSGATGLIQFMPKTAASLGTSTAALAGMTRAQQMVYVRKYFKQFPAIQGGSVDDVYMAVLYPKAVGKPDGYPLFRRGTIAYAQNAGLDTNGDGTVTKFEAAAKVKARFYGY